MKRKFLTPWVRPIVGFVLAANLALTLVFAAHGQESINQSFFLPPPGLEVAGVPGVPENIAGRLKQYREIGSTRFLGWGPDSTILLVSSHFEETAQLQYITRPRRRPTWITKSPDPIEEGQFRPGSTDILFSRDIAGTESFDLYFVKSGTKTAVQVTGGGRNISPIFSADGKTLAWGHADEGSADHRIVIAPVQDMTRQRVVHFGAGYWVPTDFSLDGKWLALRNQRARTDSSLHIVNLETGAIREVDADTKARGRSEAQFSSDGATLYFLRDDETEFNNLYAYDLKTDTKKNLTRSLAHEIDDFDVSPDGRLVILSCNESGASQFRLLETVGEHRSLGVPKLDGGIATNVAFSPNGRKIAFSYSTSLAPENVFVFRVGRARLSRWSSADLKGLTRKELVEPRRFTYPTFDFVDDLGGERRRIPAWLFKPRGQGRSQGKVPVIIYLHGGPAWQFRPRFNSIFQYWVHDLGAAVIAPNVRGSTGYGKTFEGLDNGRKRPGSLRDIAALLDWIKAQPDLDPQRVVVYGGSYGGYMALAAMMRYNDRLAGGVTASGISNLATFLDNTANWRRDLRRNEYGDERDPEMRAWLEADAPVNHPEAFTRPLFIIHGRNDTRVPITESMQMYKGVRARGRNPWLIIANDEGHGFKRKSNSDYTDAAVALFFKTLLQGEDNS